VWGAKLILLPFDPFVNWPTLSDLHFTLKGITMTFTNSITQNFKAQFPPPLAGNNNYCQLTEYLFDSFHLRANPSQAEV